MTEQEITEIIHNQKQFFNSGRTRNAAFRLDQLKKLKKGILKFQPELMDALKSDLGKSRYESYLTEIGVTLHELTHTISSLKKWMKPRRVRTPLNLQPATSKIYYSPRGLNLIISPFNYPVSLTLTPLTTAIASGNCSILKTSELTPACSRVIKSLIDEIFDPEYVVYIPGEIPEATLLLKQTFDHIFFTGSPAVGSIVMKAAAEHLTPVTLELGGKSPCIVHSDAHLDKAVNRIVFAKFMNAGQTCIAPDYILLHHQIKDRFYEKIIRRILSIYGNDASSSPDYGRIVNRRHHKRIVSLISKEKVIVGGQHHEEDRYIAPTVMRDVTLSDDIMQEEIFGPLLPVMEYENVSEIYHIVSQMPQHPLACYIFSENKMVQDQLISNIQFGGGCVNHCVQHFANQNLPFGGVGDSGIGSYHGFNGFKQFSHEKSIMKAATWFDLPLLYPPYKGKLKILNKFLR